MELIVKQVPQKDAGRGLVFIDRGDFPELGIQEGDWVSIEGVEPPENPVVGKVFPGYANDSGRKIIRMDGFTRHNANVGIDEKVNIEKIEVRDAESVGIAISRRSGIDVRGDSGMIEGMIGDRLRGRAVSEGQTVPINVNIFHTGMRWPIIITGTEPEGPVQVTDRTIVKFSRESIRMGESQGDTKRETVEPLSDITYEDIGGLSDQLGQIREMIELPMRHPELWEQLGIEPPKK